MPPNVTYATVVLSRDEAEVASWTLTGRGRPDLVVIDSLARYQLAAGRMGYSMRLRNATQELCDLLAFVGLCVEAERQAEHRKQAGVEERVHPGDSVA
ncbi:MAG: hypothetical protein QOC92_4383 [Acidimicrobiaceae bacterium]